MLAYDRYDRFDIHASDALAMDTDLASTTAPNIDVRAIRTPGLGDTTYLLSHNGIGIVVDPQRDIERFVEDRARSAWALVLQDPLSVSSGGPQFRMGC